MIARRKLIGKLFAILCGAAAFMGVALLLVLINDIVMDGYAALNWNFLTSFPSRFAAQAGIKSALFGTIWLIGLTSLFAIPIGIGAGIYLEEFAPKNRFSKFVELNISNLAGVPSIVYGMLGLTIFVRWMSLGRSLISGALIMALLVLPVIIMATQEALRAVPNSLRLAALALGTTHWQTVRHHTLPVAMPWILTGVILAISRAIGETAPLIMIGALTYIAFVPNGPMDMFTALPIQIFDWASRPQEQFHELAAAAILVLLAVLLSLNATAIYLRNRFQAKVRLS